MRLAVISDIHGNLPALEAVLDDLAGRCPDAVIVAGDLVNRGPQPAQVVDRIRDLAYPAIYGNHERYVLDAAKADDPNEGGETFAPARWSMQQLDAEQMAYLQGLPFSLPVADLLIVHASPRGDQDGIFRRNSDAELREKMGGVPRLVCGHTHVSLVRHLDDGLVVNAGSVGNSFEGDTRARYAWLERRGRGWHAEIVALPYDVERAVRAFNDSGYVPDAGAMARLFRLEFATGRNHLIPAYLAQRDAVDSKAISLADAARIYLDGVAG